MPFVPVSPWRTPFTRAGRHFRGLVLAGLGVLVALATQAATQPPGLVSQVDAGPAGTSTGIPRRPGPPRLAHFGQVQASADARHIANWSIDSGDNHDMPFVIVDKADARVFVFDSAGRLLGAAPALIGSAPGDDSVPGIGERKLSAILAHERTTPAGRFVASLARSASGEEILWVDYDASIALHRVIATVPKDRRLQRLEGRSALDRRITYGCINVPVKFYDNVISPAFARTNGVVYVLPETSPLRLVFGSYDVAAPPDAEGPPTAAR